MVLLAVLRLGRTRTECPSRGKSSANPTARRRRALLLGLAAARRLKVSCPAGGKPDASVWTGEELFRVTEQGVRELAKPNAPWTPFGACAQLRKVRHTFSVGGTWLLKRFVTDPHAEAIVGDLLERFNQASVRVAVAAVLPAIVVSMVQHVRRHAWQRCACTPKA